MAKSIVKGVMLNYIDLQFKAFYKVILVYERTLTFTHMPFSSFHGEATILLTFTLSSTPSIQQGLMAPH